MPKKRRVDLKDTTIQGARKKLVNQNGEPLKDGERLMLWDTDPPGFGVRIDHNGQVSYVVMRRFKGRVIRVTLRHPGNAEVMRYPDVRLAEARDRARDVLRMMRDGINPIEDRLTKRQAEARALDAEKNRTVLTIEGAIEDFLATKKAKRSYAQIEWRLAFAKEAWGVRPVGEITEDHVVELLAPLVDAGKLVSYDRRLADLKTFFKWCMTEARPRRCQSNPAAALKLHKVKSTKTRDLKDAEVKALWEAAETVGYPAGPLFKVLLLTGCRLREVAHMLWSEVDEAGKQWELPPERSKTGAAFVVPLANTAAAILAGLPRIDGQSHVFASVSRRGVPIGGFGHFKSALATASGITSWSFHDLRRTARTNWSKLGINRDLRERLMNHTIGDLEQVYDRYDFLHEKRQALQAWANRLGEIVSDEPRGNVVRLDARPA